MELKLNTPLTIDEIDFRVQSINKGGYATILAYKDARVDMNRLDAVYGVGYWQKKYDVINDNLFCSVGVWNGQLNQWVWVQDVGTESMAEKEKGQASDAFKRACFNLGIGRELYDYPIIQVKLLDEELDKSQLRTINRSQKTENDGWGMNSNGGDVAQVVRPEGRFPANVIFDEEAGKILNMRCPLTGEYKVGNNWKETH